METIPLFGIDECPVCADSGAVICLRSLHSRKLVFFCPLCGLAWPEPPPRYELNTVLTLEELAPAGVQLPSKREIDETGFFRLKELPRDVWIGLLKPYLRETAPHSPEI